MLVVDDDPELRELIQAYLEKQGFHVTCVESGEAMDSHLEDHDVDLLILDLMLPGEHGLSIAQRMKKHSDLPIIIVSAQGEDVDRIVGLEVGADDYLNKPFDSEVLLMKIKAIIQRKATETIADSKQFEFEIGDFHLNSKLRFLRHKSDGEPVKLSPKENDLLRLLALHENDLMPRELALTKIWRDDNYFTSRSMDVYIAKLRKYLKVDGRVEILNIHGEGFRLVVNQDA